MTTLTRGTFVLVGGNLGVVERATRQHGAGGYDVTEYGAGTLPHFAPDFTVKPAVIGENICRQARGTHWCGLVHLPDSALVEVMKADQKAKRDAAWCDSALASRLPGRLL